MLNREEFAKGMAVLAEVFEKQLSSHAIEIYYIALKNLPVEKFQKIVGNIVINNRFFPKPVDFLESAIIDDGRPEPESSWARMPKNEDDSIVWTEEEAEAYGVALPLLQDGDKIAARMAYKETYIKQVSLARAEKRKVVWKASLGFDVGRREAVIKEAVEKGRLSSSSAANILPSIEFKNAIEDKRQPLGKEITRKALPSYLREELERGERK